jgi:flagellar biosynthesis protein FliQ
LPAVLTAAAIGLVIGILQAVTQVQEQTIAAAPKILLVTLLVIFGGGVMLTMLTNYLREAAVIAFTEVPAAGNYVLPPKPRTPGQVRVQQFFKAQAQGGQSGKAAALFGKPSEDGPDVITTTVTNRTSTAAPKPGMAEQLFLQKRSGQGH